MYMGGESWRNIRKKVNISRNIERIEIEINVD